MKRTPDKLGGYDYEGEKKKTSSLRSVKDIERTTLEKGEAISDQAHAKRLRGETA